MCRAAAERDHRLRANWMYDILSTYTAEHMVVLGESSSDGRTLIAVDVLRLRLVVIPFLLSL
jgi:hypothetical protein